MGISTSHVVTCDNCKKQVADGADFIVVNLSTTVSNQVGTTVACSTSCVTGSVSNVVVPAPTTQGA